MPKLGVNIDHIATLRQARQVSYPDPVEAAKICEYAGADSIVCHLREDRRHINDSDLSLLKKSVKTRLNLEMSIADEIVNIACKVKPEQATIVPEKRQEITTEGGLEVILQGGDIRRVVQRLEKAGIAVSLFIDPDETIIKASGDLGVTIIELHTGQYANETVKEKRDEALDNLKRCVAYAHELGLTVNAGHGLNYENVTPVAKITGLEELNIGHSVISYASFFGLEKAIRKMKEIMT